jgi:putative transposase
MLKTPIASCSSNVEYRPEFQSKGLKSLDDARQWARHFVHWYNFNHRHSGIRYVGPAQRHAGEERQILAQRHAVYLQVHERNPARWSRHTRNWNPIEAVALNPERDAVINMAVQLASEQKVSAV